MVVLFDAFQTESNAAKIGCGHGWSSVAESGLSAGGLNKDNKQNTTWIAGMSQIESSLRGFAASWLDAATKSGGLSIHRSGKLGFRLPAGYGLGASDCVKESAGFRRHMDWTGQDLLAGLVLAVEGFGTIFVGADQKKADYHDNKHCLQSPVSHSDLLKVILHIH